MSRSSVAWLAVALALAPVADAGAACCRLVRVDAETAASPVRACENDGSDACAAILFTGSLAVGESQDVCAAGDTIVYQEWDPALGAFAQPVTAVCAGGDVEI